MSFLKWSDKSKAQENSSQDGSFLLDDTTLVDIDMNTMHKKK